MTNGIVNPYQPPEVVDRPALTTIATALPVIALLLTAFGGGAILLLFAIGAVACLGNVAVMLRNPEHVLFAYAGWISIPGLISGLIARQISLGRSTNRELVAIAMVFSVPTFLSLFAALSAPASQRLETIALVIVGEFALIFQFWLASKMGHLCQSSGRADDSDDQQ